MKVLSGGLQTSFQDLGRIGYMHQGVSHSGAMDQDSLRLANWLVGNPIDHVGIEITLIGPEIKFETPLIVAISGASFELTLNGRSIETNQSYRVNNGDVLTFGKCKTGARAYLAVSGKPEIPKMLDSYSTHLTANFGGFRGRALRIGDKISITPYDRKDFRLRTLPDSLRASYTGNYLVRCCNTVESDWFSHDQLNAFENQKFQVSPQSNRMGLRMAGEAIKQDYTKEMLSSGLIQGSIQIPNTGLPIISSVDGQTIGGYPRIANVINSDLPLLGQLKAGDRVSFQLIEKQSAQTLFLEKEMLFKRLFE